MRAISELIFAAICEVASSAAICVGVGVKLHPDTLELPPAFAALHLTPLAIIAACMVLSGVISDANDSQVLQAVVSSVSVLVVDVLISRQLAAKMAFHDDAMLKSVRAASGELNVSISPDSSSDDAISINAALHGAEPHASTSATSFDAEHASTHFAGDIDHMSASMTTEHSRSMPWHGTTFKGF
jgi:hypothetical protein